MPRVDSIRPLVKERITSQGPTECFGAVVVGPDGDTIVQIETVGSANRQEKGKPSQVIQFSKTGARDLLALLRKAYPDLK